jgi:hypothetical protein
LKGYEQRHYPKSDGRYYFRRWLGKVDEGDQDLLFVNLWSRPDHLCQTISLRWLSGALSPPDGSWEDHRLVIRTEIPWVDENILAAEEKESCSTVTLYSGEGHKISLSEISGNYTNTEGQARTMAGKVRQINNATATRWWRDLFQQVPACKHDKVLERVLVEIDWLLRGFLTKVWKESAMPE